jgi:hypothetical protein
MPSTHPEGVPLNVWIVPAGASGLSTRRAIADRAVEVYGGSGREVVIVDQDAGVTVGYSASALRPGDYLVVIGPTARPGADAVTETVEAATAAGLSYFQHVVALAADSASPARHVDVLVFTRRDA